MTQRTTQQNKALHLDFDLIATALNEAGFGMKAVFEVKNQEVNWCASTVKEALWRPLQLAMYDKKSTTELTTGEVSKVHDQLMKALGESLGFPYVHFPDEEHMIWAELEMERKGE